MSDRKLQTDPSELPFAERYGPQYVGRLLTKTSSANRSELRRYLKAKEAAGLKAASITNSAYNLYKLDKLTHGAPFGDLAPDELTDAMLRFSKTHSPNTTATFAIQVKAYYAWANGGKCPDAIRLAMKRRNVGRENHQEPISERDFRRMLAAASENVNTERAVFGQAFLWALWDTGFRIQELLSLKVGGVRFEEGGAELVLAADALGLKTGPRRIFVVECVPALRAWLRFHPDAENPQAPLWPAYRNPSRTMLRTNVDNLLQRLAVRADAKPPHPHLFRHTRATRAAVAGWTESHLRKYFGWSDKSSMPAHYVHLSLANMAERVKADARDTAPAEAPVVAIAAPTTAAPPADAFSAALAAILAATGLTPEQKAAAVAALASSQRNAR